MTQPTQCHNTELMQKRRDGMDVSSSCFQQCLAAESVAWTSLSLSLTPSSRVDTLSPPPPPALPFTWAKLNRLVNRWSHSADAAIIKHLDFYLWFIFLERYISYGALVWTYVAPTPLLLFCLKCASLWKVARFPGEHQVLWFPASTNHQSRHLAADAGCLAISSSFPPPAPTPA